MRRAVPLLLLVASCAAAPGCFYLWPGDPCDEDPGGDSDFDFRGCDPDNATTVVFSDRWQTLSFHCDVTGAESLVWWLEGADDGALRVIATGVPTLQLDGATIPWSAGVEDSFLKVEASAEADAPVPTHTNYWWLRLLETEP